MRLALTCLLLCLAARGVRADEIRMRDGEIVLGAVEGEEKGRLHVRVADKVRKLKVADVAERIEGEAPAAALARGEGALRPTKQPEDARARLELALFAWHARLDEDARRLAKEVGASVEAEALLAARGSDPRWGTARRKALSSGGGNAATEKAVKRALDWLAAHQDEDGKLDADGFQRHDPEDDRCDGQGGGHHGEPVPCGYDGVTTAVALMAWLASGSTPVSGPYRDNVKRALAWCLRHVRAGLRHPYGMWNYGFCTQAVADAYALTRDPALREPLRQAVAAILSLQRADGGWSYYMTIGDVPTTGVAGSALGLCRRAGIPVPAEAVDNCMAFLDARVDPGKGRSEYHDGAERKRYTPTRANTAAGLTVRALLGRLDEAKLLGKQVSALGGRKPVWKIEFKEVKTKDGRKVRAQIGNLYPYLWYYTTMALFARGGSAWSGWFGGLKRALLEGQRKDGAAAGSWDPLGTYSSSAGRVFITGLCTLMLQAPYRYAR